MGEIVEGVIAFMGLLAGVMVAFTCLLSENGLYRGKVDTSDCDPPTIRPWKERMAA